MRRAFGFLLVLVAALSLSLIGLAGEAATPAADAAAVAVPTSSAPQGIVDRVLAFLNSPTGFGYIATVVAVFLGRLFTWKPAWKVVYDKYYPVLMGFVKEAEKFIPDDTPNKGLARTDYALKKAIAFDAALAKIPTDILKLAITAVHADAEAKGNI